MLEVSKNPARLLGVEGAGSKSVNGREVERPVKQVSLKSSNNA